VTGLPERLAYALAHPIDDPDPAVCDITRYQQVERLRDGNLLLSVLAVDR
jgi:hypothetical protein